MDNHSDYAQWQDLLDGKRTSMGDHSTHYPARQRIIASSERCSSMGEAQHINELLNDCQHVRPEPSSRPTGSQG